MAAGVKVDGGVAVLFDSIKYKMKLKVAFFRMSDDNLHIIVDEDRKVMPCEEDPYGAFIKLLPSNDCRYVVFDVAYTTSESSNKNKLLFIFWSPEEAPNKTKMVYHSSEQYIKKELKLTTDWIPTTMAEVMNIKEIAARLEGAVSVEGREL